MPCVPDRLTEDVYKRQYLYGAMLYGLLFQKSPEGMAYLGECEKPLKPEDAKFLQKLAWDVLTDFYGWKK